MVTINMNDIVNKTFRMNEKIEIYNIWDNKYYPGYFIAYTNDNAIVREFGKEYTYEVSPCSIRRSDWNNKSKEEDKPKKLSPDKFKQGDQIRFFYNKEWHIGIFQYYVFEDKSCAAIIKNQTLEI